MNEETSVRGTCGHHVELMVVMTKLTQNLKWHTIIGYGLFVVGCGIIGLAIMALVQAGAIAERVKHNQKDIKRIETTLQNHLNGVRYEFENRDM